MHFLQLVKLIKHTFHERFYRNSIRRLFEIAQPVESQTSQTNDFDQEKY